MVVVVAVVVVMVVVHFTILGGTARVHRALCCVGD